MPSGYTSGVSSVTRSDGDGRSMGGRSTRDGALFTADWVLGLVQEGRVFSGNGGTVTTPITFGAGTIDTTEPDFDLSIPAGTVGIPLEIRVYMEVFGTSAQFELMASVGTGGAQGTSTAVTAKNLRADAPVASVATAVCATDAGSTYMTGNVSEFWRNGAQFSITKTAGSATVAATDPNLFVWRYSDSLIAPILYSTTAASRLNVFAASQAGTGFITVIWAELPGTALSA